MACRIDVHFLTTLYDDVIKWKHFPRYWPFVRGIHWSPVGSPHKGQWRGALMFSLICAWTDGLVNNRDAGYLRSHCVHYDVTAMYLFLNSTFENCKFDNDNTCARYWYVILIPPGATRYWNKEYRLVVTTWTNFLEPYDPVETLQVIWRSGTRRFHLRVPDLQMDCSYLNKWYQFISSIENHHGSAIFIYPW